MTTKMSSSLTKSEDGVFIRRDLKSLHRRDKEILDLFVSNDIFGIWILRFFAHGMEREERIGGQKD